jgi:aryl-phospho-beta-D-glucosidase BglC (GH1 family)
MMQGVNLLTGQGLHIEGRVMTEDDIRRISGWGMNSVRAGFSFPLTEERELEDSDFRILDRCMDWCEEYGLRCVLCMWDTDSRSWGDARNPGEIWTERSLQEAFAGIWAAVADRYGNRSNSLLFELMNEPRAVVASDWNHLAARATGAIREVDDRHTIIVESNRWGFTRSFQELEATGDPNTIYSFHFYEPIVFTNQKAPWMRTFSQFYRETVRYPGEPPRLEEYIERLPEYADEVVRRDLVTSRGLWDKERLEELLMPALDFREEQGSGLFCGEFGVNWRAPRDSAMIWLRDVLDLFSKHSIGWTYWYYRDLDFGILDNLKLGVTAPPDYVDRELLDLLLAHVR